MNLKSALSNQHNNMKTDKENKLYFWRYDVTGRVEQLWITKKDYVSYIIFNNDTHICSKYCIWYYYVTTILDFNSKNIL